MTNERGSEPERTVWDDSEPLTEDVVALEFARRFGEQFRYCHSHGHWFRWDGSIWRPDRTGIVFHHVRELARMMKSRSSKGVVASGGSSFAAGVTKFAEADPVLARTANAWDQDPMLVGCPSGTLNLKSGFVERSDPEYGITRSLAVDPADNADCPRWKAFLSDTFADQNDVIRFVQQYLGYSLTADTKEQVFVFGSGDGGNGKGVLLNTASRILGDYATTAAMDTFTTSRGERHPTDLAALRGFRFVTASETEQGKAWAELRIKQMTGGDPITARFMRRDFFTYTPQFKLFIIGNHQPDLHNVGDAMRRRLIILPFENKPPLIELDLEAILRTEWPAILRWMIDGCLDWQRYGLVRPEPVLEATNTYFTDQDTLEQWLEEECDVDLGNIHKWELRSVAFASWKAFAEGLGEPPGNDKSFKAAMVRRGFEYHRGTGGQRRIRGIHLRR